MGKHLAEDNTALVFVVFLAGIGIGVPLGFVLAQFIKPKGSIIAFDRDDKGRITAIVEK